MNIQPEQPGIDKAGEILEEAKMAVEDFRADKIHWTELAPYILRAKEARILIEELGLGSNAYAVINAYTLLKEKRPDAIEKKLGAYRNLAYLQHIRTLIPDGPDKEAILDGYIEQVLAGTLADRRLRELSKSLKAVKTEELPPAGKGAEEDLDALRSALSLLGHIVDRAVESNGYERLRIALDRECENMAVKLNCISDKHYKEAYENRKEMAV